MAENVLAPQNQGRATDYKPLYPTSLRNVSTLPPSSPHSPPPTPEDARKREERILRGRASFESRRKSLGLSDPEEMTDLTSNDEGDGAVKMELDASSSSPERPRRKRKSTGLADEAYRPSEDEADEDSAEEVLPSRRTSKRSKKELAAAIKDQTQTQTQTKSPSGKAKRAVKRVRSRFIEGSMNDRVSKRPPAEMIGVEYDEDDDVEMGGTAETVAPTATAQSGTESKTSTQSKGFKFGIGSMFKFNPLRLASNIKQAYQRQKALFEAREREKKEYEERERERKAYIAQYYEMKKKGLLVGKRVYHPDELHLEEDEDVDMEAIGQAASTEHERYNGSARKRRHSEYAVSMEGAESSVPVPVKRAEREEEAGDEDQYGEDTGDSQETQAQEQPEDGLAAEQHMANGNGHAQTKGKGTEELSNSSGEDSVPGRKPKSRHRSFDDAARSLVNKGSKVFASLTGSANMSSQSLPEGGEHPRKPPTKRELQKQQRLQKRVSALEEQLAKAKRELEEANVKCAPVPKLPDGFAQNTKNGSARTSTSSRKATSSSTASAAKAATITTAVPVSSVSASSAAAASSAMPPPPKPVQRKSAEWEPAPQEGSVSTSTLEKRIANIESDLAREQGRLASPSLEGCSTSYTTDSTGLSSPHDPSVDEGFSMIPLSPVLSKSMTSTSTSGERTVLANGRSIGNMLPDSLAGASEAASTRTRTESSGDIFLAEARRVVGEQPLRKRRAIEKGSPPPPGMARGGTPPVPRVPSELSKQKQKAALAEDGGEGDTIRVDGGA